MLFVRNVQATLPQERGSNQNPKPFVTGVCTGGAAGGGNN